MKKLLIVIDMQMDFVTGSLGSADAAAILPGVSAKVNEAHAQNTPVIFTRDTHPENYLQTFEGAHLPITHCVAGTPGHAIVPQLNVTAADIIIDKPTFGSTELAERLHGLITQDTVIELCGLCTDICVVSNALLLRAHFPGNEIVVDSAACAGVTQQSHNAALTTMRMCQITVN
ncbi:MAG: isochorismatase family cysteine hydrolase [Clostridia bacterium]